MVERLGIEEVGRINTTFADGRRGELPVAGGLTIHIGDRWTIARCIVLPQGSDPLIGQVIMEELDLIADCLNQILARDQSRRVGRGCCGCRAGRYCTDESAQSAGFRRCSTKPDSSASLPR